MKHVLSIVHYPIFGGPHNRNARLAPVLERLGVHTTVLLPDEPGNAAERLRATGLNVVQLPLSRVRATRNVLVHGRFLAGFPGQIGAIRRLIRDLQVDVVQVNGLANPHGAIAAHGMGVPVVWQVLDTYSPMMLRRIIAPLMRAYADAVMCTGHRVAREHPGIVRSPRRLVNFFPPVDTTLFRPGADIRDAARARLGLTDATLVVGTTGNINHQKGHDNFVRAAASLRQRVPGAKFMILGASHENHADYLTGLWRLAKESGLKLGSDLIAVDPASAVYELAQAMDVFWMTPRPNSEGIPTAIEEAMALEIPVVSFDVGSISELVEHGSSGFVVGQQDPEAVAALTEQHLLSAATRRQMGERGRRFVETHASLQECAARHLRAYEIAQGS
jgi:glycosyltransferase involved in cell wall biosynthesis